MILMNNFSAEPTLMRDELRDAVSRVIDSGWYVLGKELESFEESWAKICGVDYGIGVGNGMDAIEICLRAIGVGIGDEVITTPMTAFATVLAILRTGATPVLADVNADTALISQESVLRCISSKTKAVLLVHLYGQVRAISAWQELCRNHNIHLIEDCAQAHLAESNNKRAGSFGTAGAFSFYPTKNLGSLGDAGMIVSSNSEIALFAKTYRNYGQTSRYHHPMIGMNSRLDEMQAAILAVKANWLEKYTARRKSIAETYLTQVKNKFISHLAEPEFSGSHVYHLFVITCTNREALQAYLKANAIESLIHYPIPIHKQKTCTDIKRDPLGLKSSENHASLCLSIPCNPHMTSSEIIKVVDVLNSFGN
jgi:dTDP-4-amino-4,6-dideoxygalactose transaminase